MPLPAAPASLSLTSTAATLLPSQINTLFALTGVILFWRGVWNLFDTWLGTESLQGNVGSLLIGLSIILLFRIFKVWS